MEDNSRMAERKLDQQGDLIALARRCLDGYASAGIALGEWKPAAVLVPLYGRAGHERVLFTVRSNLVEHHKGQISFPGGAFSDEDPDLAMTALRETEEEVGLDRSRVEIVGRLDDIVTVSNFRVSPFVGVLRDETPTFYPSPLEVAEILDVPLRHLLDRANLTLEETSTGGEARPAYRFGQYLIYGATARILAGFLALLSESSPGA
jgi:8-oxo-dGTP pyrophosphatase MutT (NUDIX family)